MRFDEHQYLVGQGKIDIGHGRRRDRSPIGECKESCSRQSAVQINLAKNVAALPAEAFDIVADVAEWPRIVRSIKSVELLTPGPIREHTRFREARIMFGHEAIQEMEIVTMQPPHRMRLLNEQPDLHYELDHIIDAVHGGGCRVTLIFRARPTADTGRAVLPFMSPFIETRLRDELEQDLSDFASAIAARRLS
jgi:hypothetical protein